MDAAAPLPRSLGPTRQNRTVTRRLSLILAAAALALGGCGTDPEPDADRLVLSPVEDGAGHSHAPGEGHADGRLGDGFAAEAGGYRLTDVRFPDEPGTPGELTFRILDADGEPVTSYIEEQTKLLHLYAVRTDLTGFRHLHPALDDDGTWSVRVNLAGPGDHRLIAEVHPEASDAALALGTEVTVPGTWQPQAPPTGQEATTGSDGVVTVSLEQAPEVGDDGRMILRVTTADGSPVRLGNYLGTFSHVTGFHVETGQYVHTHPFGAPELTSDGTELTFHTEITEPGHYRLFVQVRLDELVHQVPITVPVAGN